MSAGSGAPWFIAFPIAAGAWYERLREAGPQQAKFVHPTDLHLTVLYLGHCGEEAARHAMQTIADMHPDWPREVTLEALKPMGSKRRPSAYSALVGQGSERLKQLLASCHAALGMQQRPGGELPHVTLLRPPRKAGRSLRAELARWAEQAPALAQPVRLDNIALYTSSAPDGAGKYQTVVHL